MPACGIDLHNLRPVPPGACFTAAYEWSSRCRQVGHDVLVVAVVCAAAAFAVLRTQQRRVAALLLLAVAGVLAVYGLFHLLPGLLLSDKG